MPVKPSPGLRTLSALGSFGAGVLCGTLVCWLLLPAALRFAHTPARSRARTPHSMPELIDDVRRLLDQIEGRQDEIKEELQRVDFRCQVLQELSAQSRSAFPITLAGQSYESSDQLNRDLQAATRRRSALTTELATLRLLGERLIRLSAPRTERPQRPSAQ